MSVGRRKFTRFGLLFLAAVLAACSKDAVTPPDAELLVTSVADDGQGSLRQVIREAPAGSVIEFSPSLRGQVIVLQRPIVLSTSVTIQGPGMDRLAISGGGATRVIESRATVEITGLTIRDGRGTGEGIGIRNVNARLVLDSVRVAGNVSGEPIGPGAGISNNGTGVVMISNSVITDNRNPHAQGGGIFNSALMSIHNSVIAGNTSVGGGGISNSGGTLRVTDSWIHSNEGGGIHHSEGNLHVESSTISQNVGGGVATNRNTLLLNSTLHGNLGSAVSLDGTADTVELVHCTVTANASTIGAGIYAPYGSVRILNTILAGNVGTVDWPDVYGGLFSLGYNLLGNVDGAVVSGNPQGVIVGIDPLLAPLRDNGGPTPTVELLPDSPAIDGADPNSGVATDQRGYRRPVDGGTGSARADIGALERGSTPVSRASGS